MGSLPSDWSTWQPTTALVLFWLGGVSFASCPGHLEGTPPFRRSQNDLEPVFFQNHQPECVRLQNGSPKWALWMIFKWNISESLDHPTMGSKDGNPPPELRCWVYTHQMGCNREIQREWFVCRPIHFHPSQLPSGNLTFYGKLPFFMGKFTINGDFQ